MMPTTPNVEGQMARSYLYDHEVKVLAAAVSVIGDSYLRTSVSRKLRKIIGDYRKRHPLTNAEWRKLVDPRIKNN